jgi:hypothetical protein
MNILAGVVLVLAAVMIIVALIQSISDEFH